MVRKIRGVSIVKAKENVMVIMRRHRKLNMLQLTYLFNQMIGKRYSWSVTEMSQFLVRNVPEVERKSVYMKGINMAHRVTMVTLNE